MYIQKVKVMKTVKKWMTFALAAAAVLSLTACSEQRTGTIRVGVKSDVAHMRDF